MNIHYASAEDAEEAFYEAIGRGDIDALMSVWADDEEIVCIHPTGQRLTGQAAIRESWRTIFANNPHLTVHIKHSVHWKSMMLDVHSVIETLYVGDKALVRKLGEIIVAMSEMEKSAKARLEEKRQAGTRPNTKEGAADSNIDTHAEWVNAAMRTMRSFMEEVKTTIQNTETFCTDIKKMDRGVANIVKELLRLADSIYSANGVKLTTFNDRANAIIDKLGGGGAKHTA